MKKNIKNLLGITMLVTSLGLTSCGKTEPVETNPIEKDIDTELFSSANENNANSQEESITKIAEETDEFQHEKEVLEHFGTDVEYFYSEEFKSISTFKIEWNVSDESYKIIGESEDERGGKVEIDLKDDSLANFLLHCADTKKITISYNQHFNLLSTLTELSNVTELNLIDCSYNSLKGIENLPNLKALRIVNCSNISDLSELSSLKNLEEIKINGTKISDISVLSELPNLKVLNLRCNEIANGDALKDHENLETVNLEYNNFENAENLQFLVAKGLLDEENVNTIIITSQDDSKYHICSTPDYKEETNLIFITYFDSKQKYFIEYRSADTTIIGFTLVDSLFNLYGLSEDLENCYGLWFKNFPNDDMIGSVANPEQYRQLLIEHCDVSNLNFITDYCGLTYLEIDNCKNVKDLDYFSGSVLHNMDDLITLKIKGTEIRDTKPLAYLKNLEGLELKNNDIDDYNFLLTLDNLKAAIIKIDNYPVDPEALIELQNRGVEVYVIGYLLPERKESSNKEYKRTTGM